MNQDSHELVRALSAETLKLRRSPSFWLPLVGLSMALLQGGLFLVSQQGYTWQNFNMWHSLWITFLMPLFLALLAGLTAVREVRAQGGGLWWRPISWETQARAEWLASLLVSGLLNAAVILPSLLMGMFIQLKGKIPYDTLFILVLVLTLSASPLLALGQRLARRIGLFGGLMVAFVGNFSGVLSAEKWWWFLNPWAWPIRATAPLTATHANGLALEPNSPMWHVSPWPIVGVALLVSVLLLWWPVALPQTAPSRRRASRQQSKAGNLRSWHWSGPLAAEMVKYRHTPMSWLIILTPVTVALIGFVWLGADGIWEFWTLLVLPFAVALTAALAWGWETDSWDILRSRTTPHAQLYTAKLGVLWLGANASFTLLLCLCALIGKPLPTPILLALVHGCSTFALLAVHLWLAVCFGTGITLGVGIVMTLLTAVLGGTGLSEHLWAVFPWVWARVLPLVEVDTWPYLCVLLGIGGVWTWLGTRVFR